MYEAKTNPLHKQQMRETHQLQLLDKKQRINRITKLQQKQTPTYMQRTIW